MLQYNGFLSRVGFLERYFVHSLELGLLSVGGGLWELFFVLYCTNEMHRGIPSAILELARLNMVVPLVSEACSPGQSGPSTHWVHLQCGNRVHRSERHRGPRGGSSMRKKKMEGRGGNINQIKRKRVLFRQSLRRMAKQRDV